MGMDAVFEISRQGLDYERLRLETATRNIAASDVALKPGQAASVKNVSVGADFASAVGASGTLGLRQVDQQVGVREVHDPSNPMADAHGMVRYPRIDMAEQMGVLVSASRAYEANVRAFNALHGMLLTAMKIGGR